MPKGPGVLCIYMAYEEHFLGGKVYSAVKWFDSLIVDLVFFENP
jgi:hypothetical protein